MEEGEEGTRSVEEDVASWWELPGTLGLNWAAHKPSSPLEPGRVPQCVNAQRLSHNDLTRAPLICTPPVAAPHAPAVAALAEAGVGNDLSGPSAAYHWGGRRLRVGGRQPPIVITPRLPFLARASLISLPAPVG